MTKQELIEEVATSAGLTKAAAEKAVAGVFAAITNTLQKGETATFVGFGSFAVNSRAARTGRNPQTGKEMKISEKKVAKFTPGKALKEAVAKGK